ncbi:HNH endonuclease signature motif containing protein [Pseudonocardia humida]|uniref:DUF222 domain-containing protein n=1 Tax=Pseudonocardia humida TaxID=2800819 RepID=A0ABT1A9T9_9PSEU|nr:DUF222 domain-containing protein [Pseudonocardia humida]MCO1659802.1 DUF222 domain-containing protein [Pseudonocardia humida]
MQHVDLIARLLDSPAARRIPPHAWAGIEEQIAAVADTCTPTELARFGAELVRAYDQDGAEPDDREPVQVNELRLTPLPGGGGKISGVFTDPVRFAMIATVIDAKATPLTAQDPRSAAERNADALAEVCGFVATHGDKILPDKAGERPHIALTVRLADLENRARAACLDLGDTPTPAALRALCCDAKVIPIVLDGDSQPLDIGREARTIPLPIRRAIVARDHGCAHPGCDRPPSWCEIHHIKEWARGGHTKTDNLVMLCWTHHQEIHSTEWLVRIARDSLPEFIPPAWLDKERTPRRHPRTAPPGRPDSTRPPQTNPGRSVSRVPRRPVGTGAHHPPEAPARSEVARRAGAPEARTEPGSAEASSSAQADEPRRSATAPRAAALHVLTRPARLVAAAPDLTQLGAVGGQIAAGRLQRDLPGARECGRPASRPDRS